MNELLLIFLCGLASFVSAVAVNMYLAGDCCGQRISKS